VTNGVGWTSQTTNETAPWLIGEPCVDRWFGVFCCPDNQRSLTRDGQLCSRNGASTEPDTPLAQVRSDANQICMAATSSTGTDAGLARCVVVAVRLPRNNMVVNGTVGGASELGEGLGSIVDLVELDFTDNRLKGPVPIYFSDARMQRLELAGNDFLYALPGDDVNEPAPSVQRLVQHCANPDVRCTGVPPVSCDAFKPESGSDSSFYVVETLNPDHCYLCDLDSSSAIFTIVGVALLAILFCALYAYLLLRHGEMLRSGVASFTIMYAHTKTIYVFRDLRIDWPHPTRDTLRLMSFNPLQIELARPECLVSGSVGEDRGGIYYMIMCYKLGAILFVFMLALTAQVAFKVQRWRSNGGWRWGWWLGHDTRDEKVHNDDKIEMLESTFYDMQVIMSFSSICALISSPVQKTQYGRAAYYMACCLLGWDICLAFKYFLYLRTYSHLKHPEDNAAADIPDPLWSTHQRSSANARARRSSVDPRRSSVYREDVDLRPVRLHCVHISADRLKERVEFLTLKYSAHAPRYQFIVWARQLALMGLVFFTDIIEPVSIDLTANNATTAGSSSVSQKSIHVVRVQLFVAIFIVLYFWSLHLRYQCTCPTNAPYQCTCPEVELGTRFRPRHVRNALTACVLCCCLSGQIRSKIASSPSSLEPTCFCFRWQWPTPSSLR
jgi:hypothetical protein